MTAAGTLMAKASTVPVRDVPPEEIFALAAEFEVSSRVLLAEVHKWQAPAFYATAEEALRRPGPPTYVPSVVTSAFSLELYFKTLITLERGSYSVVKAHHLGKLFGMVSTAHRKRITERFEAETQHHPRWMILKDKRYKPANPKDWQIEGVLANAANTFPEYRYLFEGIKTVTDLTFEPVVRATRETILEINPDWTKLVSPMLPRP